MSSFQADVAFGDAAAEELKEMLQIVIGSENAEVVTLGGKDNPDQVIFPAGSTEHEECETKTEGDGGWILYGNIFLEKMRRNGEIIGPWMYSKNPLSKWFCNYIACLKMGIVGHPAHIAEVVDELGAEGIATWRNVKRDGSEYSGWAVPPEHVVARMQDKGYFVFMIEKNIDVNGNLDPIVTEEFQDRWVHSKNERKPKPVRLLKAA